MIVKRDEFNKPKIVWNRIAAIKQFGFVKDEMYIQDSMHFITGNNLFYLSAILNSKTIQWLLSLVIGEAAGGNAGNADNIWNLCIPKPLSNTDKIYSELLSDKKYYEINSRIYELYDLSDEEIKFIENN